MFKSGDKVRFSEGETRRSASIQNNQAYRKQYYPDCDVFVVDRVVNGLVYFVGYEYGCFPDRVELIKEEKPLMINDLKNGDVVRIKNGTTELASHPLKDNIEYCNRIYGGQREFTVDGIDLRYQTVLFKENPNPCYFDRLELVSSKVEKKTVVVDKKKAQKNTSKSKTQNLWIVWDSCGDEFYMRSSHQTREQARKSPTSGNKKKITKIVVDIPKLH